jgi:hypothetical protein
MSDRMSDNACYVANVLRAALLSTSHVFDVVFCCITLKSREKRAPLVGSSEIIKSRSTQPRTRRKQFQVQLSISCYENWCVSAWWQSQVLQFRQLLQSQRGLQLQQGQAERRRRQH